MVLLIDAKNILHRNYAVMGEHWALSGWLKSILVFYRDYGPGQLIVCWDAKDGIAPRLRLFPEYKAQRVHDPEKETAIDRVEERLKLLLSYLGVMQAWAPEAEADDVMATLAADSRNGPVRILTADKDLWQCVSANVSVVRPGEGKGCRFVTPQVVKMEMGIEPSQVPDWKAMVGDASDNIPGAEGIGPVAATKILERYRTVEEVLAKGQDLSPRYRTLLAKSIDNVRLSLKLATVNASVSIISFLPRQTDFVAAKTHLDEWGMEALGADLSAWAQIGVGGAQK